MVTHSDEIIEAVGGMSRFQIIFIFVILGPKTIVSWGMMMMSFAGVPPDFWWCVDNVAANVSGSYINGSNVGTLNYTKSMICPAENSSSCKFVYSQEKNTIINEWDLLCDRSHIKPLIIAVQMTGVLTGCVLSGQSADTFGRKKTYIITFVLHAGFNLVAAFSINWQMFIVLRFLIGSMVGAVLTVSYPYYMEFVGQYWRPVTGVVPWWQIGTAFSAMTCWLRPNWSDLHMIVAALHIPFLLGWWFVPESLRWLAVHGHLKQAEEVVDKMARYNGTEKPANTSRILKALADEELKARESSTRYTYLDIYRNWSICWRSLVIQFTWMSLSFVTYGIAFGVGRLHGNLYFNMFIFGVITIPGTAFVYFLTNRIGRRWTAFVFFSITSAAAFGVVIASQFGASGRGLVTTALALTCRFGVSSAWATFQMITSESYPTPIRNLGYGAANSVARIGAIASPYVFDMGTDSLLPPFAVVGSVMALCSVLSLTMRETMGAPLEDNTAKLMFDKTSDEGNDTALTNLSKSDLKEDDINVISDDCDDL